MLETIVKYGPSVGPLLSGIALCAAAAAAWATYAFYYKRTMDTAWLERYRVLYGEFWKDPRIAEVRNWIASEIEYEKLARILSERLKSDNNRLAESDNRTLEQIDYFCSVLMRIEFIDRRRMTKSQRELWRMTFDDYWLQKINQREELRRYIEKYWPDVQLTRQ